MAEIGQETVELSRLVGSAAKEAYLSLRELVEKSKSSELSDSDKKIGILKYLNKTQQRLLRLNVVAKWCQQVPLIQYSQQLKSTLSSHDTCFTQAADSLYFMHEGLQQARAPLYDVPTAIDILGTGRYQHLPQCLKNIGSLGMLNEDQQKPALKKLDMLVREKLLEVSLPKEISEVKISDGTVLLRVDGEFKVLMTLGYRGHLSMWRILHLELLVGEKGGHVKLEEGRRHIIGDDLERRMVAVNNPFVILYSVLHEICLALIMDTVIRQVQALKQGRWKDAIRFELISDGSLGQSGNVDSSQMNQDAETDSTVLRTPGLKILYWLEINKNLGNSEVGSCPFVKIEPGQDLQMKCSHSSFILDPLTDKEAELSLDQSCIDVEKLMLRATCCNRYTCLLEIYKELGKDGRICRDAGDVLLQCCEDELNAGYKKENKSNVEGQDVLCVRAYGSSYFTLGINIRSGRFLLQSTKNILASSRLLECEEALNNGSMTVAEVFVSLRSKIILHLFASTGRFLGLQVYEHGFSALNLPKNILNGSSTLLMGFPESVSSYFLLMQLEKDFTPLFKLLETQPDTSEKLQSVGNLNHVISIKNVDISQMQVLEDKLNFSLLNSVKLHSFTATRMDTNQASEIVPLSEFSIRSDNVNSAVPSSFSSIVDEVFELERGSPAPSFSVHPPTLMLNISSGHSICSVPANLYSSKTITSSPNWEVGIAKLNPNYSNSTYLSNNLMSLSHSSSASLLSSGPGRNKSVKKLSASKSDQDLASHRYPHSADSLYTIMDEDELILGKNSVRVPQQTVPLVSTSNARASVARYFGGSRCNSRVTPPLSEEPDTTAFCSSGLDIVPGSGTRQQKRTVSDMLNLLPPLRCVETNYRSRKRRKIVSAPGEQPSSPVVISSEVTGKTEGYSYATLIAEAYKGNAPSTVYVSALLHVVSHCSLCIKHARLTSQMEALDIPYDEEFHEGNASSNLWFRLPSSTGDPWKHICLQLGRPGSMCWDVKINDQHFRDLNELQKGSNSTPWGSGVRSANMSDIDSHISYDPDGIVLCYKTVEADSIKKLVADIQRLSNSRMFALGMRKLLGVSSEEKLEDSTTCDGKAPTGLQGVPEVVSKIPEQMRKAFRIEAVGLLSLWFSFYSGVLARFVVEWESGKEGCKMHVSPDLHWPHTKFLEDFVNGGEVASLLDCIHLTTGPLHALVAATRPARATPANSTVSTSQASSGLGGNRGASTTSASPGTHNHHGTATVAAAGKVGPGGIVPTSLLPIDVSVVLRGPYWIRIIYRKHFSVDMRCFAGDQVWLQPATPPKGGPSVGGSLPCPQFRPFIMEHVAQELNGLDPNFTGAQQTVGLGNSNNVIPTAGPQISANNVNRVSFPGSGGISRPGNQVNGINRAGNSPQASSNLAVVSPGLSLRRSPGAGVPTHVRELNTAIIGLGDDGGYGGGWVPIFALKKVLRGILKYLGVLWLFSQLPDLLKEILGSILKDNEGALLNLDQEQPTLRFFVGGYVFAVSVHRVQLLLQVLSVKRFHHSPQNSGVAQEELTPVEIGEICDYFSRRVASEPYDASRVASFITLLTLPISVLREFLKLIAWKKGLAQAQSGDIAPAQRSRIELCLENHSGLNTSGNPMYSSGSKSSIHYDRPHNTVDFGLTVVLDPTNIPDMSAAGGASWLPYCVFVMLRYSFGEKPTVSFLGIEGSHGGQACWLQLDAWETCKQRVVRTVEMNAHSAVDLNQGRLRIIADGIQRTLNVCLQGLRDGNPITGSAATA